MRPYPAPHLARKNLDASFLNCLSHFFVRWIGLKLLDFDYNPSFTNHYFVIWKPTSFDWCGKTLRNVTTKVAILMELVFRLSFKHMFASYTSFLGISSSRISLTVPTSEEGRPVGVGGSSFNRAAGAGA